MDISKNSIKKFLAVVFTLVISAQTLVAQTEYIVDFISDYELKVSVTVAQNNSNFNYFIFPEITPNYFKEKSFRNKITDFKLNVNNQYSVYTNIGDSVSLPAHFSSFSYTVTLDSIEKTEFLPVQSAANQHLKLLNVSTFLGFLNSISAPMKLQIIKNDTLLYKQTASYQFFQESPICIACNTQKIALNSTKVQVETFQTIIEQKKLNDYISDAFYAFENMGYKGSFEDNKIIIIIDTLSQNSGAVANQNAIVFYINEVDKYTIQKTIIHELIHWVVPNLKSWKNEAFAEFLAIKFMRKSALISDQEFLNVMSFNMRKADYFKHYSLNDIYLNKTPFSAKENYFALYSKGAVMAWLLDLIIFKNSNTKLSLETYVLYGIEPKQGFDKVILAQEIDAFENNYVKNNIGFSYNHFLTFMGVLYEENKIEEVKAIQNLLIEKNGKDIVILDNGGVNLLSENDIVLSIDGSIYWSDMKQILNRKDNKTNVFVVLRDGKKKTIRVNGKDTISIRKRFVLSFFETLTNEQKANWLNYLN